MGLLLLVPVIIIVVVVGAAFYLFSLARIALKDPNTKHEHKTRSDLDHRHDEAVANTRGR